MRLGLEESRNKWRGSCRVLQVEERKRDGRLAELFEERNGARRI
jgi:hypothetical protein